MGERYKQPCQHHQPCVESTAGPQGTLSSQRSLSKMIMAKANHLKSATNGVQTVPVPIPLLNPCDPLPHRSQSPHTCECHHLATLFLQAAAATAWTSLSINPKRTFARPI